jgi:ABC-type phosphate transport system substrate-binding protein
MAMSPVGASRRESKCLEVGTLPAAGRPTACGARLAIVLWSVLGMLLAQPCASQVAIGTVVTVIVNQDNPVENLSLAELRDILSGQRTYWSARRPVSLILMPGRGTAERRTVLNVVLAMNEASYKKHWLGRVFRAEAARAPITADSPDGVARAVARTRGALGLVAQAAPNIREAAPNVRVVRINGALPGDAGYPLR